MSLEHEPPGVWRATCDTCGDSLVLDTDGDDDRETAEDELDRRGWEARPVETGKFAADGAGLRKYKVEYHEHDCADCR